MSIEFTIFLIKMISFEGRGHLKFIFAMSLVYLNMDLEGELAFLGPSLCMLHNKEPQC